MDGPWYCIGYSSKFTVTVVTVVQYYPCSICHVLLDTHILFVLVIKQKGASDCTLRWFKQLKRGQLITHKSLLWQFLQNFPFICRSDIVSLRFTTNALLFVHSHGVVSEPQTMYWIFWLKGHQTGWVFFVFTTMLIFRIC